MNATSFKELYFKEFESLLRIALYIVKDSVVAEDIVQEVFSKVWEKRESLSEIENLKSYLVQMTKNKAFDLYSASKKMNTVILELEETEKSVEDSELDFLFRKALEKAVSQLTPKCRLIFSLSRFEGLTNEEISVYLNISKRTVETQISNALKAFRTDLKPIFETHLALITGLSVISLLQQI